MALVAAAACPHPPLLVPELAAGAAAELDGLRAACRTAVQRLVAAAPEVLYVVGADTAPHATSFAPWGADPASGPDVPEPLPLSLLVGAWLTAGRHRSFVAVDPDLDAAACAGLGADLAGSADRVGLLVMGDGSTRRTERAPGALDPRAEGFDAGAARALGTADVEALLALDPGLAAELGVSGRAPWQVLAGAARAAGHRPAGELLAELAPYGVGYAVAAWAPS